MTINPTQLRNLLVTKYAYKESQVDRTIDKLLNLEPRLLQAFENWLAVGKISETPVYHGVSPKLLSETYSGIKPPAIFLLLDWIRREPKQAFQALNYEYGKLPEIKVPADTN